MLDDDIEEAENGTICPRIEVTIKLIEKNRAHSVLIN